MSDVQFCKDEMVNLIREDNKLYEIYFTVILCIGELTGIGYSLAFHFKGDGWPITIWTFKHQKILKKHYPHAICPAHR